MGKWLAALTSNCDLVSLPRRRKGANPCVFKGVPSERQYKFTDTNPPHLCLQSALHRIKSDELWFWHAGLPLCVVELQPPTAAGQEAVVKQTLLGPLTAAPSTGPASAVPSVTHVVTGGTYFGAYCPDQQEGGYALVSCVVAPGWYQGSESAGASEANFKVLSAVAETDSGRCPLVVLHLMSVSCAQTPCCYCYSAAGFDYRDWSMESAEVLKEKYPGCAPAAMIAKLAKD